MITSKVISARSYYQNVQKFYIILENTKIFQNILQDFIFLKRIVQYGGPNTNWKL